MLRTPLPAPLLRLGLCVAVAATLTSACGDGGSTVATPPSTSTVATTPTTTGASPTGAAPTATPSSDIDQEIALTYAAGAITGDTGRVKVALGSRVRIVVTSDVADELHLHVYDVKRDLIPGQPAEILFTADVPGQVELELEQSRTTLVRLVIS